MVRCKSAFCKCTVSCHLVAFQTPWYIALKLCFDASIIVFTMPLYENKTEIWQSNVERTAAVVGETGAG